jgi:hypothetical protein
MVDLEEGAQPPFGPIYNFLQDKLVVFCEYINENLEKGFIRHSKFLVCALILFVEKRMDPLECALITMG